MALRKNQANLTTAEKTAFVEAVLAQKQRPSRLHPDSPTNSRYDDFVEVHLNAMLVMMETPPAPSWGHMAAAFGPWHRALLLEFERELQTVDPAVTIPYWDWTVDQRTTSTLWRADFMGGDGRRTDGQVMDGAFAGDNGLWTIGVADSARSPKFLRRALGRTTDAPSLPSTDLQRRMLLRTPYDTAPWDDMLRDSNDATMWGGFRIGLEVALHNLVHRWVGGNMLEMASPNDPVFWLHHCNCDRLWSVWQFQHAGAPGYLPGSAGPFGHNLNDPMIFHATGALAPWDTIYRPIELLDHRTTGVSYDTDPDGAPPVTPPTTRPGPTPVGPAPHQHHHGHALPMFALPSDIAGLQATME